MQRQKRMVQGDTKMVLGCEEGASGLDVPILRWERKHPARKVFGWKSLRNVEIGGSVGGLCSEVLAISKTSP